MHEGLLIFIIVILIAYFYMYGSAQVSGYEGAIGTDPGIQGLPISDPVQVATVSNYEMRKREILSKSGEHDLPYFNSNAAVADAELLNADGDAQSCAQDFANSGATFNDWVKANAVDSSLIQNHTQWVNDTGTRGTYTGRTYTADMHDSYDPIPWIGLMRPQNVPVGNPDQIPDIDRTLYSNKQTILF